MSDPQGQAALVRAWTDSLEAFTRGRIMDYQLIEVGNRLAEALAAPPLEAHVPTRAQVEALTRYRAGTATDAQWVRLDDVLALYDGQSQEAQKPATEPYCTCGHALLYHASWGSCLIVDCKCKKFTEHK